MRSFSAFIGKEFCEAARTYKLLIMGAVFLLFGMMNPITAKITPQLLAEFMPEGIEIKLGEPTALDSWAQFFKNVPQMGLIVLIIMFSGIMANEFSRGTLVNVLTKGLSRSVVILAKFAATVLIWTASYVLCFAVTYAYTEYFWPAAGVPNLLFSVFCLWLFGVFLLASLLLGGVIFKNSYGCLLFTGGLTAVLLLLGIFPKLQDINPIALSSSNMALLYEQMPIADFSIPIILCCAATAAFVMSAVLLFNKKQL